MEELRRWTKIKLEFLNLPSYHILQMSKQSILQVPQMFESNACKHFAMLTVCNLIFEFQTSDKNLLLFLVLAQELECSCNDNNYTNFKNIAELWLLTRSEVLGALLIRVQYYQTSRHFRTCLCSILANSGTWWWSVHSTILSGGTKHLWYCRAR